MPDSSDLIEVVVDVPANVDLPSLAESTAAAFRVLFPLIHQAQTNQSLAVNSLLEHARSYVKAIDYSIIAAQHGFNIAEEAIEFSNIEKHSTEDERMKYLRGMWDMAKDGHRNTKQAVDGFKSVRRTIEDLIKDVQIDESLLPNGDSVLTESNLIFLESNLGVLEGFSESVSKYISWWNFMTMNAASVNARAEQLVFNYSSLREKSVVKKWKDMKEAYINYNEKITLLQTQYREYQWLSTKQEQNEVRKGPDERSQQVEANAQAGKREEENVKLEDDIPGAQPEAVAKPQETISQETEREAAEILAEAKERRQREAEETQQNEAASKSQCRCIIM